MPHKRQPSLPKLSEKEEELLWGLEEALIADVDSWYTSSLACCDACVDEYVAKWPLAYIMENGLQYTQTPADAFYSGSRRVRSVVTKKQFEELLSYIECPNCGGPLGPNLFSFELPFNPDAFEEDLRDLGTRAKTAPFLLLTNRFAEQIRSEISCLCSEVKSDRPKGHFYRGRVLPLSGARRKDFGPPPASETKKAVTTMQGDLPSIWPIAELLAGKSADIQRTPSLLRLSSLRDQLRSSISQNQRR